ncbi:MAG: asparaginase domain-containing protein [Collinsella sp.]
MLYALDEHSHDVSIVFGGVAIAGTRARKQRTMSFNAFISVNYPPIAYIRNDRIVRNGLHGTHQGETRCVSTTASTRACLSLSSRPA